ncbi:A-kinase anchor protein 5 [Tiliqua scincoides]|uniref:A-kinase anchor protein 5 n=1 Tax=Tiliqua scincoides TaxID=71010 RepID=UPI0034629795
MGELAKDIEMESPQLSEVPNATKASLPDVSPAKKASVFCFKKRKKSCEKVIEEEDNQELDSQAPKPANQHTNTACNEAKVSNPSWMSGGAWLAFKRLVTSRRRPKSTLKKQPHFGSQVGLEMNAEESGLPRFAKDQASSSLKIPCLKFSRSRKKTSQLDSPEQVDHGDKAEEITSVLNNKTKSERENMAVEDSPSPKQRPSRDPQEKGGVIGVVKNIEDVFISPEENIFVVEMRADSDQYTDFVVQSEITHSEAVLETEEEKQIFQLHHGSLYGNPEEAENKREEFQFEVGLLVLQDLSGNECSVFDAEEANGTPAKEAELEKVGGVTEVMEDSNGASEGGSVEVMLHCSPPVVEGEASGMPGDAEEEATPEEDKCALPGVGIVITITEAEEFQEEEEEPSYVCEPFTFPQASKQKGHKKSSRGPDSGHKRESKPSSQVPSPFSANDQEHRTSEQYEMLLIETAASLVKAAIQSSIEQLINEIALEQNKQNSFL